jgi:predicted transcriptional regulator
MHDTIPVSDIMIEDVVTVSPDATASEAARLLCAEEVSSAVTVQDGAPVGIVTEATSSLTSVTGRTSAVSRFARSCRRR